MKRLAVIPAREGSKRIKNKNIKNFCGKPIISYALNAAKESGLFDTIHVSTESEEIANIVRDLGFTIDFLRDISLADDITPIIPVLKWDVEKYQSKNIYFDEVVLIMACAPLIDATDLKKASLIMDKNNGAKSVISISSYPAPIEWAFENKNTLLTPVNPGMFKIRSQDLTKKYYDTGAFIFFPVETILSSEGAGDDTGYVGYEIERLKAIDIDDQEDWELAELTMRALLKK